MVLTLFNGLLVGLKALLETRRKIFLLNFLAPFFSPFVNGRYLLLGGQVVRG